MGLNISPDGGSWSYSGFQQFRLALAAEEGIRLDDMLGFGGSGEWSTDGGELITPLAPLLHHSDCDGVLEPDEAAMILRRLPAILDRWNQLDTEAGFERAYDVEQGRRLVAALQHAVEHRSVVVFG